MKIALAYALPQRHVWLRLEVPEGCTVGEAVERSGIRRQFPEIDLHENIGIFGQPVQLDTVLEEGDRVEIYRAVDYDPLVVRDRKRARNQRNAALRNA